MSTALAGPESTLEDVHLAFSRLREGLDTVILGQPSLKERVLACLLGGGHGLDGNTRSLDAGIAAHNLFVGNHSDAIQNVGHDHSPNSSFM